MIWLSMNWLSSLARKAVQITLWTHAQVQAGIGLVVGEGFQLKINFLQNFYFSTMYNEGDVD